MATINPSTKIITPQHKVFYFKYLPPQEIYYKTIKFSSNFDSGNLFEVEQEDNATYNIWPSTDSGTKSKGSVKNLFYFYVRGFPLQSRIKFVIKCFCVVSSQKKLNDNYRPVYRISTNGQWEQIPSSAQILLNEENQLELSFIFDFATNETIKHFFCFSFPFSYSDSIYYLNNLSDSYEFHDQIYFTKELLCKSYEKRAIELITITEKSDKLNNILLKPVVLITARIHPGEYPSSHTINGILEFLLSENDTRAFALRSLFQFKLVPMLNPDGVYHGHFRMDVHQENLNRYYSSPDSELQPQCYELLKLAENLTKEKRLFMFIDIHAHAANKNSFIFGNVYNALNDFVQQVETGLYSKLISLNTLNFEYEQCDFSEKQMNAYDKYEKLSKENSSRVQMFKQFGIVHSYTLECSFYAPQNLLSQSSLAPPRNVNKIFENQYYYEYDAVDNKNSEQYTVNQGRFNIATYYNLGKAVIISILDLFGKNPYSRIPNTIYHDLSKLRAEVARQIQKMDRFRQCNLQKISKELTAFANEKIYENI